MLQPREVLSPIITSTPFDNTFPMSGCTHDIKPFLSSWIFGCHHSQPSLTLWPREVLSPIIISTPSILTSHTSLLQVSTLYHVDQLISRVTLLFPASASFLSTSTLVSKNVAVTWFSFLHKWWASNEIERLVIALFFHCPPWCSTSAHTTPWWVLLCNSYNFQFKSKTLGLDRPSMPSSNEHIPQIFTSISKVSSLS